MIFGEVYVCIYMTCNVCQTVLLLATSCCMWLCAISLVKMLLVQRISMTFKLIEYYH